MKRANLISLAVILIIAGCQKTERAIHPEQKNELLYTLVDSTYYSYKDFPTAIIDDASFPGVSKFWYSGPLKIMIRAKMNSLAKTMKEEAGFSSATWGFKNYILHYTSTDGAGRPITLSESVILPVGNSWNHKCSRIMLDNPYTHLDGKECATESLGLTSAFVTDDLILIRPDLEGYGISSDRTHPYIIHPVVARQTTDGALAAIEFLKQRKLGLAEEYSLYNVGCSQGASYALATQKYIENDCNAGVQSTLNLTKTICGGGAYRPDDVFSDILSAEQLYYTVMIPLTILGIKSGFPEMMEGIEISEFFSEKFLNSGALEMIEKKEEHSSVVLDLIREKVGNSAADILSEEVLTEGSTLNTIIRKALERCDLSEGWLPRAEVAMYHNPDDEFISYSSAAKTAEMLKDGNISFKKVYSLIPSMQHSGSLFTFYINLFTEGVK